MLFRLIAAVVAFLGVLGAFVQHPDGVPVQALLSVAVVVTAILGFGWFVVEDRSVS